MSNALAADLSLALHQQDAPARMRSLGIGVRPDETTAEWTRRAEDSIVCAVRDCTASD